MHWGALEGISTGSPWSETPFIKEIKPVPDGPEVREGGQMNPRSETKGEGARVACWLAGLRGVQVADAMWGAGRRRCSPLSPAWASGRTAPLTELENWGSWASSQGPEVSFDVLNWSPEVGNTQLIHPAEVRAGDLGGFSVQAAADTGKGQGLSHQGKRGRRKDQTETWKPQRFRAGEEAEQAREAGR